MDTMPFDGKRMIFGGFHHLQANVGHYGVFNGRRWEREIYPVVRNLILARE